MDARVKFTNDFMEKTMNRKMSKHRVGELRYDKLKQAAKDGRLQFADSKADVARLAGFTTKQATNSGWQWVKKLIEKGCLEELPHGFKANGQNSYQYVLTDAPYSKPRKPVSYLKRTATSPTLKAIGVNGGTRAGSFANTIKRAERFQKLILAEQAGRFNEPIHRDVFYHIADPLFTKVGGEGFVGTFVRKGFIKESVSAVDRNGKVLFSYHISDEAKEFVKTVFPNADKPATKEEPAAEETPVESEPQSVEPAEPTEETLKETLKEHSKAKLTVGDITIETDDADLIVAIIKGLK